MSSLKTSNLSANKFKVGDKVKVVSHKNTVKRFRGDSANLAEIGTEGIVNNIRDFCVGITNEMFLLDMDDLILLDNLEIVNKEANTSQNESNKKSVESKPYNPLVAQEGGGHYKNRGIQPIEYSEANNLGACQHSVVKYITRHQDKNGIEDLSKIIHFTFLEAYFKYGEQGSTELKEKVLKLLGEHG